MSVETPNWLSEITSAADNDQEDTLDDLNLMDDLRDQIDTADVITPAEEASISRRKRASFEFGMHPWQLFFLSVLLFLDVAIVGLLFLIILGRIVIPVL